MVIERLQEIQDRFKLAKNLQIQEQQELAVMRFTEHELKEIIDILGEQIFMKKNEARVVKFMKENSFYGVLKKGD